MRVCSAAAGAVLLLGCADSPDHSQSAVEEWHLTAEPLVSIGTVSGDERYALGLVSNAVYTAGGGIAVVDVMSRRLLFYDEEGRFVTSAGGDGSGPGEFRMPQLAMPYRGDSIAMYDLRQHRISIFDAAGVHGRDVAILASRTQSMPGYRMGGGCCAINNALSDGSFILQYPEVIPEPTTPSRHGATMLLRMLPDGEPADTLGTFRGTRYRPDATTPYGVRGYRPGQRFQITTVGTSVIGGNGESPMLVRVTAGSIDTLLLDVAQHPFTDELIGEYDAAYQAYYERRPEAFEGSPPEPSSRSEFMPDVPIHSRLYSDVEGNLWLQQWQVPYRDEPVVYHVHAQDGRQLARITLPAGSRLAGLGQDRLLLIEMDSLDVQYVRSYGIVRAGES